MTVSLLLLILAAVCFLLATAGIPTGRVNILALGLLLWVIAVMIGGSHVVALR